MGRADAIAAEAAKPMRYFSHDADAASDIKCRRLIRRLGMEGYGRWWRLCELLAASDGHVLSLRTEEDADIIAEELCLDGTAELMSFVMVLKDVGLLVLPGDGTAYSERMLANAEYFGKRRAAASKGGYAKAAKQRK
jgi:hypothetical protein